MQPMPGLDPRERKRILANLTDETNGAALYDALAAAEKDSRLSEVYRRLASVERRHAARWRQKLEDAQESYAPPRVSWRTKTLGWIARRFGTSAVLPSVQSLEQADSSKYARQPDALDFHTDEKAHGRVIRMMTSMRGGFAGSEVAMLEGRHRRAGGNALRAAVLGANDGLVSNLSLVMGVAGAAMSQKAVVITGLAGLLAGAGSMAMGEWLSVQSSRELYEHQIDTEQEEITAMPEEEEEELALIYESRGVDDATARKLASSVMANRETAIDAMAREELGINPEELGGSAWQAAITSFFLFALGAIVPLSPLFFTNLKLGVILSLLFSTVALFAIGAAITLFTGRGVLVSGLRSVIFGLAAAGRVYAIGHAVGLAAHTPPG